MKTCILCGEHYATSTEYCFADGEVLTALGDIQPHSSPIQRRELPSFHLNQPSEFEELTDAPIPQSLQTKALGTTSSSSSEMSDSVNDTEYLPENVEDISIFLDRDPHPLITQPPPSEHVEETPPQLFGSPPPLPSRTSIPDRRDSLVKPAPVPSFLAATPAPVSRSQSTEKHEDRAAPETGKKLVPILGMFAVVLTGFATIGIMTMVGVWKKTSDTPSQPPALPPMTTEAPGAATLQEPMDESEKQVGNNKVPEVLPPPVEVAIREPQPIAESKITPSQPTKPVKSAPPIKSTTTVPSNPPTHVETSHPEPEQPKVTGKVFVALPGQDGRKLSVDGRQVGALPAQVELTEGIHTFTVENEDGTTSQVTREVIFQNGRAFIQL